MKICKTKPPAKARQMAIIPSMNRATKGINKAIEMGNCEYHLENSNSHTCIPTICRLILLGYDIYYNLIGGKWFVKVSWCHGCCGNVFESGSFDDRPRERTLAWLIREMESSVQNTK